MFYRFNEVTQEWETGTRINMPDKTVLDKDNQSNSAGFIWCEEPPKEYLEYLKSQKL